MKKKMCWWTLFLPFGLLFAGILPLGSWVVAQTRPSSTLNAVAAPIDSTQTRTGPIGKLVDILNADQTIGTATSRTLRGNVQLRQENTLLRAQEVVERFDSNVITLSGKVWMVQNGDTLTADQIVYNTLNKQAKASGNIRVSNGQTRIFTTSGEYDAQTKLVHFTTGARIIDSTAVITARRGSFSNQDKWGNFEGDVKLVDGKTTLTATKGSYNTTFKWGEFEGNVRLMDDEMALTAAKGVYYRELQEAFFYGNVELWHPDFFLQADSVTHNRKTDISFARGKVKLERYEKRAPQTTIKTVQPARIFLFGGSLYHTNASKSSILRGNPLVVRLKATKEDTAVLDTLLLAARILEVNEPEEGYQHIVVKGQTRMRQGAFAARSEVTQYTKWNREPDFREEVQLFDTPMVWSQQNQISGDTLRLLLKDGKPDSLSVFGNAFVAQMDSVLNKINQLRGKKLFGFFEQDTLRSATIFPQAEALYFSKNDQNKLSQGIELKSDRLHLTFEKEKIKTLDALKPDGVIYEAEIIPEKFQLNGFNWKPDKRPQKKEFPVTDEQWGWIQKRMNLLPERKQIEAVITTPVKQMPEKPRGKRTTAKRRNR